MESIKKITDTMYEDRLNVYWDNEFVGTLYSNKKGKKIKFYFQYDKNWEHNPISLSLPIPEDKNILYNATNFFNFLSFEEMQRKIICLNLGIDENDSYRLLKMFGKDCAGALQILPPDIEPDYNNETILRNVDEEIKEFLSDRIKIVNDLVGVKNIILDCNAKMSLAGNQDKLPCVFKNNSFFVPEKGMSTHILKTPNRIYGNVPENEYISITLAGLCGLPVPEASLISINNKVCYLTKRYDRSQSKRLHQEDLAQAYNSKEKYQETGGLCFKDCADIFNKYGLSYEEKINFVKAAIYNYCIGNADAHARNFSIIIPKNGQPKLAPFYDIMNCMMYAGISPRMGMYIGKTSNIMNITQKSWELFAEDMEIELNVIEDCKTEIIDNITEKLPILLETFNKLELDRFVLAYKTIVNKFVANMAKMNFSGPKLSM